MSKTRFDLQNELELIIHSRNVYFQPPENFKMSYPCVVYSFDGLDARHADDYLYNRCNKYTLQVIDKNPESPIPDILLKHFRMCSFDRHYIADNLNHYNLTLYY